MKRLALTVLLVFLGHRDVVAIGEDPRTNHEHHIADMTQRGAEAMGFDQAKTLHHFRLRQNGGMVEVQAKDSGDAVSITKIQHHLALEKEKFSRGDFGAPEHTHGRVPPGVPTMRQLRSQIRYEFRKTAQGGSLMISSGNPVAVQAIHEFLKFQIQEHNSGDAVTVQ